MDHSSSISATPSHFLEPLPYHKKLRDHFKAQKKTWDWFASKATKETHLEEHKKSLLKNTYRLERADHKELYQLADECCKTLTIDANVILYQQNNSTQLNAGIFILESEAHIVFSGGVISLLDKEEMKCLLGHELGHYLFGKIEGEEFEITNRLVVSLANDHRSENAIIETARVYQLYNELFCDAAALKVSNNYEAAIRTLVKLETGLTEVNAESYLKQVREILEGEEDSSLNESHPEAYIRSMALFLRSQDQEKLQEMMVKFIEGPLDMDRLDIFKQKMMQDITRDLLQLIVKPNWMATTSLLNLCDQYFQNFSRSEGKWSAQELASHLEKADESIHTYVSYVLLDFAKSDPDLENVPLAFLAELAELLGIKESFDRIVRKELKLTVREYKETMKEAMTALQKQSESSDDSIFQD